MGYGHGPVIDGDGQLIGIHVVSPANDEITTAVGQIPSLLSVNAISEVNGFIRHMDAPRRFLGHAAAFGLTEAITMAVVHRMLAGMGGPDGLKPRPAAVAGIKQSLFAKLLQAFS